jgi:hypothetical protein
MAKSRDAPGFALLQGLSDAPDDEERCRTWHESGMKRIAMLDSYDSYICLEWAGRAFTAQVLESFCSCKPVEILYIEVTRQPAWGRRALISQPDLIRTALFRSSLAEDAWRIRTADAT